MRLMIQSYADYMQPVNFRVSVGTWNINGGKHFRSIAFKHEHITDWLLDLPKIIRSIAPGKWLLTVMQLFANFDFSSRIVCIFRFHIVNFSVVDCHLSCIKQQGEVMSQ